MLCLLHNRCRLARWRGSWGSLQRAEEIDGANDIVLYYDMSEAVCYYDAQRFVLYEFGILVRGPSSQ